MPRPTFRTFVGDDDDLDDLSPAGSQDIVSLPAFTPRQWELLPDLLQAVRHTVSLTDGHPCGDIEHAAEALGQLVDSFDEAASSS